jgi:hypothetical protein
MTAGGLAVPTAVERTEGLTLKLKSGCGWFEELELLPPPPQLAIESEIAQRFPHNANLNLSIGDSRRTGAGSECWTEANYTLRPTVPLAIRTCGEHVSPSGSPFSGRRHLF